MAKIVHERNGCIGCGACAAVCPKYWEMGGDGKASLKGASPDGDNFALELPEAECNKEAASACPVNVIKVEE